MYLKNINLKRLKQLVSPLLILLVLVLPVAVVSCEDMMGNYLEKPPGGDVTEDTIFSSRTQVETFLTSIYQMGRGRDVCQLVSHELVERGFYLG